MILNRDDFFSRVNSIVGERTDEESIKFIEDMSDTYNSLEQSAQQSGGEWEQKYHDLDEAWKEKYKSRFFSGTSNIITGDCNKEEPKEKEETVL